MEAVLKDLDAAFGSMKGSIKEELQAKLRDEAQEPTREAIQVASLHTEAADFYIRQNLNVVTLEELAQQGRQVLTWPSLVPRKVNVG